MTQVDIYRVKNSCMYIVALSTKEIGFHTTRKFDEPFGAWSHFENFLEGTSVDKCEGRILG
jgi:hypothetical protein